MPSSEASWHCAAQYKEPLFVPPDYRGPGRALPRYAVRKRSAAVVASEITTKSTAWSFALVWCASAGSRFQPIGLFPKCGSPNILLKLTRLRFELHAVLFPGKAIRELPIY